MRPRDMAYVWHAHDIEELYDLRRVPFELANLATRPAHRQALQDMRDVLSEQMTRFNDPLARHSRWRVLVNS